MPDRTRPVVTNDDQSARLTAWCASCHASQPCAPGGPPYRCATCGTPVPNPVLRLQVRQPAAPPAVEAPQRHAAD